MSSTIYSSSYNKDFCGPRAPLALDSVLIENFNNQYNTLLTLITQSCHVLPAEFQPLKPEKCPPSLCPTCVWGLGKFGECFSLLKWKVPSPESLQAMKYHLLQEACGQNVCVLLRCWSCTEDSVCPGHWYWGDGGEKLVATSFLT